MSVNARAMRSRSSGSSRAVRVHRPRGGDHRPEIGGHRDRQPRGPHPLVPERAHRDLPPLVVAPEAAVDGDAGVGEEDVVQHGVAGEVADRPAFDAGRLDVDDERGDALVLGVAFERGGIGTEEEQTEAREVGGADPRLLAVHDVVVAGPVVAPDRGGAHVGQVGARLGLAEALAPVLVGAEDPGEPTLLLLLGAPLEDHRADLPHPVGVVDAGSAHARHLLGVDRVLHRRRLAPVPRRGAS